MLHTADTRGNLQCPKLYRKIRSFSHSDTNYSNLKYLSWNALDFYYLPTWWAERPQEPIITEIFYL